MLTTLRETTATNILFMDIWTNKGELMMLNNIFVVLRWRERLSKLRCGIVLCCLFFIKVVDCIGAVNPGLTYINIFSHSETLLVWRLTGNLGNMTLIFVNFYSDDCFTF